MPHIAIIVNGRERERRELRRPLLVGRAAECDICVDDSQMSRRHCRLEQAGDAWRVTDLGSHNGTLVNGSNVRQHLLAEGDRIEVGQTVLIYSHTSVAARRPRDPHEAAFHARIANEVDLRTPEETITSTRRPLPKVKPPKPPNTSHPTKLKGKSPPAQTVQHGSPLAFSRPKPRPAIDHPPQGSSTSPEEGLFSRMLARWRKKPEEG